MRNNKDNNVALRSSENILSPSSLRASETVANQCSVDGGAKSEVNETALSTLPNAREIAEFIVLEARINLKSDSFYEIQKKINFFRFSKNQAPAKRILSLFEAMNLFAALVGYKKPWDHKKIIRDKWGEYSILFGVKIAYDVWSNIHYGFIGIKLGFNPELLLRAAGLAQFMEGAVDRAWIERYVAQELPLMEAFDDPRDQTAIKIGIGLGQKLDDLTLSSLIAAIRERIGWI